jgi:hypothetical protein
MIKYYDKYLSEIEQRRENINFFNEFSTLLIILC